MMSNASLPYAALQSFSPMDDAALTAALAAEIQSNPAKIVALDDDPTGIQTVHGVAVYTDWSIDSVRKGFAEENKLFYLLTNSRGLSSGETASVHRKIADTLLRVSGETSKPFLLVSRSDSTMRGHYPLETDVLRKELEAKSDQRFDAEILCLFFKEGGRYTLNDMHYVHMGDELVPAGETEFAKDKTFSYRSSNLRDYIEEKTGGAVRAGDVVSVPLDALRRADYDTVEKILLSVSGYKRVIVNAVDYCDLKVFCTALYRAIAKGKRFLFRTAASFLKTLGGVSDKPLLAREELVDLHNPNGGILLIGSHVNKTTRQLEVLMQSGLDVEFVEFNQHLVLEKGGLERETARVTQVVEDVIGSGKSAAVYTRRDRFDLDTDDPEAQLSVSVRISDAVTSVIGNLKLCPSFIVAKGGITSSDVGTKALRVKKAEAMGQILPGIPVWKTGTESKFPGLPYVIFPGNVGGDHAMEEIVRILMIGR